MPEHTLVSEETAFKEMLITIVGQESKCFIEGKVWYWATRCVLVLGEEMLQQILLLKVMDEKELSRGQLEGPGRLAIATGKTALTEQIIRDLEKTIGEPYSDRAIVNIVINLPHKSTPKRVMRIFEDREDYGQVTCASITSCGR